MQNAVRSLRIGTWLGWQVNSNWADPFLFLIYSISKPLASALILVVMLKVVGQGGVQGPLFDFMYIGNMFYIYVASILGGISWSVSEDREHYHMLKFLMITPLAYYFYLMGQGLAKFLIGTLSVIVMLIIGILFLDLHINPALVDWPLFSLSMILGVIGMSALGVLLAAYTLSALRMLWMVGDTVATAMFLFTGAIFPISLLPGVFQVVCLCLPMTYWLALMRRALLGPEALAFVPFDASWTNTGLFAAFAAITAITVVLSVLVYRYSMHRMIVIGNVDLDSTH